MIYCDIKIMCLLVENNELYAKQLLIKVASKRELFQFSEAEPNN